MAFISYTERPISALSSVGEARAGLIWVDFNFVMSQQAPIQWSLYSWAAQANHGHPTVQYLKFAKCIRIEDSFADASPSGSNNIVRQIKCHLLVIVNRKSQRSTCPKQVIMDPRKSSNSLSVSGIYFQPLQEHRSSCNSNLTQIIDKLFSKTSGK